MRTSWDVPKHRGLSLLIVDLRSPGIEIRPIKEITAAWQFCEEFFTDVVVPETNLVGEENHGWDVIRGLLAIEHAWVGRGGAKRAGHRRDVSDLVELANARGLAADAGVRRNLAGLHVQIEVQKLISARVSSGIEAGKLHRECGSLLKIGNDSIALRCAEAAMALAGEQGVTWRTSDSQGGSWALAYLTSRSAPIGGGTAEIMRNNVSEKVLGLPREPNPHRGVPFNQIPHN